MSIVKSRGTAHSNQVREMILSDTGVTLADIYTAGGEVLMGTMRWQKESSERVANEVADVSGRLKRVTLDPEEAVLEVRARSLQTELIAKQAEKALLVRTMESPQKGTLRRPHPHTGVAGRGCSKTWITVTTNEPLLRIQLSTLYRRGYGELHAGLG
jgi:hypothetical protein